jgi:hypothetical protein
MVVANEPSPVRDPTYVLSQRSRALDLGLDDVSSAHAADGGILEMGSETSDPVSAGYGIVVDERDDGSSRGGCAGGHGVDDVRVRNDNERNAVAFKLAGCSVTLGVVAARHDNDLAGTPYLLE